MHMLGWRQDWKRLADVVAPPSPNALDSSVAAASVASPASPGGASVGSKDNAADDARETGIEGDQEEQEDDVNDGGDTVEEGAPNYVLQARLLRLMSILTTNQKKIASQWRAK